MIIVLPSAIIPSTCRRVKMVSLRGIASDGLVIKTIAEGRMLQLSVHEITMVDRRRTLYRFL